ncbi:MAG: hypothetical protein ACR2P2_02715 [Nakamurella sp.]
MCVRYSYQASSSRPTARANFPALNSCHTSSYTISDIPELCMLPPDQDHLVVVVH